MSVLYYINGDRVSAAEAKRFVSAEAEVHGYEPGNWEHSWMSRSRSEAALLCLLVTTGCYAGLFHAYLGA